MRRPYVDPTHFGDQLGFSLKKSLKKITKTVKSVPHIVSHAASEVSQEVKENPVLFSPVYGAIRGDPYSTMTVEVAGTILGLPPGTATAGISLLRTGLDAAGVGVNAPGFPPAGSGGPDLSTSVLPGDAGIEPAPDRMGRRTKTALVVGAIGLAALWYWKRRR